LTGDARTYFTEQDELGNSPKTYEDFEDMLRTRFLSSNVREVSFRNLRYLRQKGTVHEYTKEFDKLLSQSGPHSKNDEINFYLTGLHTEIEALLNSNKEENQKSLALLQETAARIYESLKYKINKGKNNQEQKKTFEKNAKKGGEKGTKAFKTHITPIKNAPEDTICFNCAVKGHYKKDCPKLEESKERKNKGTKANHVRADESSSSNSDSIEGFAARYTATCSCNQRKSSTDDNYSANFAIVGGDPQAREEDVSMEETYRKVRFSDILYTPDLEQSLISIREITKEGNEVTFTSDGYVTLKNTVGHWKIGKQVGMDYNLLRKPVRIGDFSAFKTDLKNIESVTPAKHLSIAQLWHERLGHIISQDSA
jgi:hypothetical protein